MSFSIKGTVLQVQSGGFIYNGASVALLRERGIPEGDILLGVQGFLKASIDEEAERRRSVLVTPGSGQAMEYQQVQVEAFDAIASKDAGRVVEAGAYPMLAASVGIDIDPLTGLPAADVLGVARNVQAAVLKAWTPFGAQIRRVRLAAKAAIEAAATVEAAATAAASIEWPAAV